MTIPPGAKVEPCCGPGVTATISVLGDRHEEEDISVRNERTKCVRGVRLWGNGISRVDDALHDTWNVASVIGTRVAQHASLPL